jgi:hypothetical protein
MEPVIAKQSLDDVRRQKQGPKALHSVGVTMVGDTGFEPVTSRM